MKKIIVCLFLALVCCSQLSWAKQRKNSKEKTVAQESVQDSLSAYLMVYHKDQDHGLHMAYSYDGYTWTALKND